MSKTIEVTFAFEIGDEVVSGTAWRLADHSAEYYRLTHKTAHHDSYVNKRAIGVPVFQVTSRIAEECPGGVQRHYICRGYVADKYGEGVPHMHEPMKFLEHELIAYVPQEMPTGGVEK